MTVESTTDVRDDALRLLSNGLYVLTTALDDMIHAAAVSWITQASFQPPLVLTALRGNSRLAQTVQKSRRFALNILGADQEALAERFLTHLTLPADGLDLAGHDYRLTQGRCPLVTEALAWLECRVAAEPSTPGDHALILAEVTGAGVRRPRQPLVLWRTRWSYGGLRD